jgi:hypothetical protein
MNNFTPKTSIDEYIDKSELNARIYQILLYLQDSKENGRYKLKRQPLEIFNQAYAICEELQKVKHPEETAVPIWDRLRNRLRNSFLSYETSVIFSCVFVLLSFTSKDNPNMRYFLNRIGQKIDSIYFQEFEPLLKEELTYITALPASFEFLKSEADRIQDLDKRELYYADYLTRFKQAKSKGNILQQINDEIELIKRTKELSNIEKPAATVEKETPDVASIKVRSVVILELLKKLQLGTAQNDLTKICKLIAFLTGNSYDRIYNELQKGVFFSNYHKKEIQEANKLLAELNTSISIDKDRKY